MMLVLPIKSPLLVRDKLLQWHQMYDAQQAFHGWPWYSQTKDGSSNSIDPFHPRWDVKPWTMHGFCLTQEYPNNSTNMTPHHVVPDEPLMYVMQSRTRNFWRPKMLPYMAVSALIPHPAVVTATIGTCSTQKTSESIGEKVVLWHIVSKENKHAKAIFRQ